MSDGWPLPPTPLAQHRARVDALFEQALDLAPAARDGFLARVCGADSGLRAEVAELLGLAARPLPGLEPGALTAGPLWQELAQELGPDPDSDPDSDPLIFPGSRVGPWRLVCELGRGGMGAVYLGERADGEYEQHAALKLLQSATVSEELLRRFERERQILATLEHPNIARLLDGGRTADGRPYFAMEYVDGRPIDRYCDEKRLNVDDRLDLFLQVGRALQHAHRNLVVHRDLKPSNIVVTEDGEVKLLDFGIAVFLVESDDSQGTRTVGALLTPQYASPEQILGGRVTPASDVYQLGLLLYELLTGERAQPAAGSAPGGWARAICEHEPVRPSLRARSSMSAVPFAAARRTTPAALARKLRGDLDNVLLMALRKEPERRYGSAAELVDDLERYRRRRPVRARADALGYRVGKFVERHRAALATALAAAVILGAALGLITAQRLAAERQAARARQMEHMLGQLFASASPGSEPPTVRRMLDEGVRLAREELRGQPESQARLLTLLGRTYNSLGLYDQSIAVLQEALTLHGAIPEQEDEATSETLSWLAQGMHYTSRFPEALALSRRLYELRRRRFGPEDGATVDARLLVADILHSLGRLPEAEVEARGALAYLRRPGGDANVLALGLANLGNVLRDRGELSEAEEVFRESVALSRRLHGPLDQQALHSEIYLARTLIARGEPAAAESMLRGDLSGLERIHGGDHPAIGEALRELGHALIALRRYPEAAACLERALSVFRRFLDERHTMLARVRVHQAELELERGEPAKAVAIAHDALDRFARLGLTEHPAALDTRRILGRALLALGDRSTAVKVLEDCLALEERLFVGADARTEQTRAALASARAK